MRKTGFFKTNTNFILQLLILFEFEYRRTFRFSDNLKQRYYVLFNEIRKA